VRRKPEHGLRMEKTLRGNATPNHGQHPSGHAVDLVTSGHAVLETGFEHSPAFTWLQHHGAACGFQLSDPRGSAHRIDYEPWHGYWNPHEISSAPAGSSSKHAKTTPQLNDLKDK